MTKISFVFSFYNEEETLPFLIKNVREVMAREEHYEMIFVNDASTDKSADVIAREASGDKKNRIVLVNMSRRFGVEESFLAGISVAGGEAVILMYTDMQDPPQVVPAMLEHFRAGAEIVHSVRSKRVGEHPLKSLAAFFAYRIIGRLAETKIPYDAGEFKLLSRNVAQHLLNLPEAEPYLRGLIPWIGFKQAYVEYEMPPRVGGQKKVPLFGKKAWTVFLNGVTSFSDLPVYWILLTGVVGMTLAVLLGVLHSPAGLLIFCWATLMMAVGILGLYMLKIYKNTRGRPRYIIKEVKRFS